MTRQELLIENKKLAHENAKLKYQLEMIEGQLNKLQKFVFGSSNERHYSAPDSKQLKLFTDKQSESKSAEQTEEEFVEVKAYKKRKENKSRKKSCGRKPLPESLRRELEELLPEGYDPETMTIIGEDVTELLAYKKAEIFVRRLVRPRVVVKGDEDQGVLQTKLPERIVPKGLADDSLIIKMIVEKMLYHMPIDRFRKKLNQLGVNFTSNLMVNWFHSAAELLLPLYHLMHDDLLAQDYLQVDESTIKVLPEKKKNNCHLGYMWVMNSVPLRATLFHYGSGRSMKEASKLIKNFKGILQADGYEVYASLKDKNHFTLIHCMAHARRKFYDAKNNDPPRAEHFLNLVQELYKTEEKARTTHCTPEQRLLLRQQEATPVLEKLKKWLEEEASKNTSGLNSPIEKAIKYTLSRWEGLTAYLNDGQLEIDNNLIENAIRPLALGRKNYLFAGNHHAAQNLALLYSFVVTAVRNDLDVHKYLDWLFNKVLNNKITNEAINWLPYRLNQETKTLLSK